MPARRSIDAAGTSRVGYLDGVAAVNVTSPGSRSRAGTPARAASPISGKGGAFRLVEDAELKLEQSAVVGNAAGDNGGGISSLGEVTIDESLIAGNTVDGRRGELIGGGIYSASGGRLQLLNSTVSGNTVIEPSTGRRAAAASTPRTSSTSST